MFEELSALSLSLSVFTAVMIFFPTTVHCTVATLRSSCTVFHNRTWGLLRNFFRHWAVNESRTKWRWSSAAVEAVPFCSLLSSYILLADLDVRFALVLTTLCKGELHRPPVSIVHGCGGASLKSRHLHGTLGEGGSDGSWTDHSKVPLDPSGLLLLLYTHLSESNSVRLRLLHLRPTECWCLQLSLQWPLSRGPFRSLTPEMSTDIGKVMTAVLSRINNSDCIQEYGIADHDAAKWRHVSASPSYQVVAAGFSHIPQWTKHHSSPAWSSRGSITGRVKRHSWCTASPLLTYSLQEEMLCSNCCNCTSTCTSTFTSCGTTFSSPVTGVRLRGLQFSRYLNLQAHQLRSRYVIVKTDRRGQLGCTSTVRVACP